VRSNAHLGLTIELVDEGVGLFHNLRRLGRLQRKARGRRNERGRKRAVSADSFFFLFSLNESKNRHVRIVLSLEAYVPSLMGFEWEIIEGWVERGV
jgi:hypothetical protein